MKNNAKQESRSGFGIIDVLADEISLEEQKLSDRKMLLAAKIDNAMKSRGIKKGQLARMVGKQPSEITKWLSGTHNFTVETLWEIGDALNIDLINIQEGESVSVIYLAHTSARNQSFSTTWPTPFKSNDL
jgi:ribosome-binding protein aMBF1 (putative translation factor)